MIVTRFAPSPTGDPHIGNIRTALFNFLFAKHHGGRFMLRIEDTDRTRHNIESVDVINEALEWLNIIPENFDNPMIQSERLDKYKQAALKLVDQGDAYVCTCSKERLETVRNERSQKKLPPGYDGHCRELKIPFQEGCVIRMAAPKNKEIKFNDLIRGEISFNSNSIDDQVLLKSDGFPTYHLAHVIDDHEMATTHIIRGDEWLPSTPKHIILFEMMGYEPPQYAHPPIILSPSKGKLSKRDGATTILEYKRMGYLPEAIINFLVLLGWSPKNDEEFFQLNQLIEKFDISGINKSPAIFDLAKLNNFNSHYLKNLSSERIREIFPSYGLDNLNDGEIFLIKRGGNSTILEAIEKINSLRQEKPLDVEKIIFKKSDKQKTLLGLEKSYQKLSEISDWTDTNIQESLEKVVNENSLNNGDVFWPIRYSMSYEEKSAPPSEIGIALGKEKTLSRIKSAITALAK